MSLLSARLSDISIDDIQQFCDEKHIEGIWLDYKQALPSKDGIPKLISALANHQGGICLLGVSEAPGPGGAGVADKIVGVPKSDNCEQRIISMCLDGIHPPISPEVKSFELRTDTTKEVLLIRVAASDLCPHELIGSRRVYVRSTDRSFLASDGIDAGVRQIEWMLNRREKAIEWRKELLSRAYRRSIHNSVPPPPGSVVSPVLEVSVIPTFPSEPLCNMHELTTCIFDDVRKIVDFGTDDSSTSQSSVSAHFGQDVPHSHIRPKRTYFEATQFGSVFLRTFVQDEIPWMGAAKQVITARNCAYLFRKCVLASEKLLRLLKFAGLVEVTIRAEGFQSPMCYTSGRYQHTGELGKQPVDSAFSLSASALAHELGDEKFLESVFMEFLLSTGYGKSVFTDGSPKSYIDTAEVDLNL